MGLWEAPKHENEEGLGESMQHGGTYATVVGLHVGGNVWPKTMKNKETKIVL